MNGSSVDAPCRLNGRALEFNRISFGILEIHSGAVPFGAEIMVHGSKIDSVIEKVDSQGLKVKGFDTKADVIDIVALLARGRATGQAQLAIGIDQVNLGHARAQMNHPQACILLGKAAAKHIGVKPEHDAKVPAAQNDMIDAEDLHTPLTQLVPLCGNRGLQWPFVTSQRRCLRVGLTNPC